jgi:urease accessory protein
MSVQAKATSRLLMLLGVLAVTSLFPARAEAHLNSTGLGPVYDGLIHFLLNPEDILAVLALALFAGQRGTAHGRRVLFVLPIAWLVGGFLALTTTAAHGTALTFISFLLLGGLLAADAKLSIPLITVLASVIGLFHGYLNGAGMGQPTDGALALLGIFLAIFVLVALAASFVEPLRQQWARIAVRVAGSWIAATGLLMLGWAIRRAQ